MNNTMQTTLRALRLSGPARTLEARYAQMRVAIDHDDLELAVGGLGKLIGEVPSATAILDRFLHHAESITMKGKSYRLRNKAANEPPNTTES